MPNETESKPRKKPGFFDKLKPWLVRGAFMLVGAKLGIPGLGAIAGSALRNSAEFAGETLSIVLQPGETPEMARTRIEDELTAQGIEPDANSWMFDDVTGELQFAVPADLADTAAETVGGIADLTADTAGAIGGSMADISDGLIF